MIHKGDVKQGVAGHTANDLASVKVAGSGEAVDKLVLAPISALVGRDSGDQHGQGGDEDTKGLHGCVVGLGLGDGGGMCENETLLSRWFVLFVMDVSVFGIEFQR